MNKKKVIAVIVICVVIGILVPIVVNNMNTGTTEDERQYVSSAYVYVLAAATAYDDFMQATGSNSTLDLSAKIDRAIDCKDRLEQIKTALSATPYPASLREAHEAARDFIGHLLNAADANLDGYYAFDDNQWSTGFAKFDEVKAEQDEAMAAYNLFMSLVKATQNGS